MEQNVVIALVAGLALGWLLRGRRARREQQPRSVPLPAPARPIEADVQSELEALLRDRRKIEAIKRYRTHYDASLKEAKEAVEAIQRRLGASG